MKKARALVDIAGTNIKCGDFFEADDDIVAERIAAGEADDKALEPDVYGDEPVPAPKKHPGRPKVVDAEPSEPAEKGKGKK